MPNESVNYWKFATIGILLVAATVAATLLVIGRDSKTEPPHSPTAQVDETPVQGTEGKAASAPMPAGVAPVNRQHSARVGNSSSALPPKSVMEACNEYANDHVNSKTEEVLRDAALGAAIGAAVGAAGGAIAGGGKGAGKGAAIGGVTGVAGGTLYGLNEAKSHDAQYQAAYASCMRSKGY